MATVRRVRRIIRKIDPWTVLKVSSIVSVVMAIAFVLGTVMFWSVVDAAGIPQKIVDLLVKITLLEEGENPFANTEQMFRALIFGAAVLAIVWTALATLAAVVYNLVADVVGGIEFVVLEETLLPPAPPAPAPAPAWTALPAGTAASTNGGSSVDVPTEETPVPVI
ncbi:MAG TPA: DUF3566 domain-containing protein [Acidimicrobiia bacterium]|jgi:hypothetical protein